LGALAHCAAQESAMNAQATELAARLIRNFN
jgi:hypothetical protein